MLPRIFPSVEEDNSNVAVKEDANGNDDTFLRRMSQDEEEGLDLEILDLDLEEEGAIVGDDSWLISLVDGARTSGSTDSFLRPSLDANESPRKLSLVAKLDCLQKGSPVRYQPPGVLYGDRSSDRANHLGMNGASSTPKQNYFDSRTFVRNRRPEFVGDSSSPFRRLHNQYPAFSGDTDDNSPSPVKLYNAAGDEEDGAGLNSTFCKPLNSTPVGQPRLNSTFNRSTPGSQPFERSLNATFRKSERFALNDTFKVGEERDEEDRSSNASDGSSVRLNNVGDVQHIAKMQEESLRQPYNHHVSNANATFSPSSDNSTNSVSQENVVSYSPGKEDGEARFHRQYSSQDSLPDSPYSSQSLDSQPSINPDRIGRSMPNLNKRGLSSTSKVEVSNRSTLKVVPPPSSGYGLSSRYHGSETRLPTGGGRRAELPQQQRPLSNSQLTRRLDTSATRVPAQQHQAPRYSQAPPSRPLPAPHSTSSIRPPGSTSAMTRIARPAAASSIPRPGSRLPTFQRSIGIPRPSDNGRKGGEWREDCY